MSDFEKVSEDRFVCFIPFYGYKQKCWQWKEWMTQHLVKKWQSRANSRTQQQVCSIRRDNQLPILLIKYQWIPPLHLVYSALCSCTECFSSDFLIVVFNADCLERVKWWQQQTCKFGWRDISIAQRVAEWTIILCLCVSFSWEVGTGLRDVPAALPVFVSQSFITSALCAIQRSHVTIFEQLQTIVACLLFSIDREDRDLVWSDGVWEFGELRGREKGTLWYDLAVVLVFSFFLMF